MSFSTDHSTLREAFDLNRERVELPNSHITIVTAWFESAAVPLLPGTSHYQCAKHDRVFLDDTIAPGPLATDEARMCLPDVAVSENQRFRVAIFTDSRHQRHTGAILLLHGLNERTWYKYLPWAKRLVETTGKAVILFPIAFHMNRAPDAWGDPRLMKQVSVRRQAQSPTIVNSTFANAAISTRLQENPQRFCWSGLQTIEDIAQFIDEVRANLHMPIAPDAKVDIFAYSIGAFLAEILLMANVGQHFTDTRLFMFCGGATVDRMYANSRYILDSDATIALHALFVSRLPNELQHEPRLGHYISRAHSEGQIFRWLLSYHEHKFEREARLRQLATQVAATVLRKDNVVPPSEVFSALQGEARDIPINVGVLDFPFGYSHVVPFPLDAPEPDLSRGFDQVFDAATAHLG
jgi:hypothetical protein